jgi:hypothetical protein
MHAWEQVALQKIYKNYSVAIVDSWMFREVEGQFLRHVYNEEENSRISYFRSFMKEKNIDHNENIHQINIVEFNTKGGLHAL